MDPTFITEWGPWAFIVYVLVKDILPKLAPDIVKVLGKKISTEDRLFTLLDNNAKVITTLNLSFTQLSETIKRIDTRFESLKEEVQDNTAAVKEKT